MIQALVRWAPATVWAAFLFYLSSRSVLSVPSLPIGDRVGHFVLFAVLGNALAWGARRWRRHLSEVVLLLLGVVFAATDEWHQSMVPPREPSVADFVADALGLVVGYLLARRLLEAPRAGTVSRDR